MKRFRCLLILLLIGVMGFNIKAFSQRELLPLNPETRLIEFTELVTVDSSLTQEILHYKAKEWFAQSFRSANDVIQMDDKDAGIIIGKGLFSTRYTVGDIHFTMKVQVKDGRYKYWISNFIHEELTHNWSGGLIENEKPDCGYYFMAKKVWLQYIPEAIIEKVNFMKKSLKTAFSNVQNKKDEW
jgi:hypothetical protein